MCKDDPPKGLQSPRERIATFSAHSRLSFPGEGCSWACISGCYPSSSSQKLEFVVCALELVCCVDRPSKWGMDVGELSAVPASQPPLTAQGRKQKEGRRG